MEYGSMDYNMRAIMLVQNAWLVTFRILPSTAALYAVDIRRRVHEDVAIFV